MIHETHQLFLQHCLLIVPIGIEIFVRIGLLVRVEILLIVPIGIEIVCFLIKLYGFFSFNRTNRN